METQADTDQPATNDSGDTDTGSAVKRAESNFPFPTFREHQQEILHEAARALYENDDISIVVIDAPTGIGKSGINIALGNTATGGAFYTTPQKKLRNQLQSDEDLEQHHVALRSRRDYTCNSAPSDISDPNKTYSCDTCPVNTRDDYSCREYSCDYWSAKEEGMNNSLVTLTFSFLIVDNRIPTYIDTEESGEVQISFADRESLIIDEGHTLAEQVTSLHAGFILNNQTIETASVHIYDKESQSSADLPEYVEDAFPYQTFNEEIEAILSDYPPWTDIDDLGAEDVEPALRELHSSLNMKINALDAVSLTESGEEVKSEFESLVWKLKNVLEDLENDEPWVVSGGVVSDGEYEVQLKPVYADGFLEDNVWNRAENIILSTATLPYRHNPKKWLKRIGLDPSEAKIISKPMPFPAENRQIRLDHQIGKMSGGGVDDHWDDIVAKVEELSRKHDGEKGLVHTVSYDRAERLHKALPNLTMLHEQDSPLTSEGLIKKWQRSDKQLLLSPSMTEGVDLEGDKCRWQILLKVPFRNLNDPRVDYLINEENDWEWYNDLAAREIIQSVGRAVRSKEDYATYYVFDTAFDRVMSGRMPEWFEEAIVE